MFIKNAIFTSQPANDSERKNPFCSKKIVLISSLVSMVFITLMGIFLIGSGTIGLLASHGLLPPILIKLTVFSTSSNSVSIACMVFGGFSISGSLLGFFCIALQICKQPLLKNPEVSKMKYEVPQQKDPRIDAFFNAVRMKKRESIQDYLNQGIIDEKNESGQTVLMIAANLASPIIVQDLIAAGANIHIKDNYGNTALHYAAIDVFEMNNTELVDRKQTLQLLLNAGIDIDAKNEIDCRAEDKISKNELLEVFTQFRSL